MEVTEIPIEYLHKSRFNPREFIDDYELQTLTDTIHECGILNPLLVVRISEDNYEVLDGYRRLLASQNRGLKTLPCIIKALNEVEQETVVLVSMIHHLQHEPYELAKLLYQLHKKGNTFEEIGSKIGRSDSYVNRYIQFYKDISSRVGIKVRNRAVGKSERFVINLTEAEYLCTLSEDLQIALANRIETVGMDEEELRDKINEIEKIKNAVYSAPAELRKQVEEDIIKKPDVLVNTSLAEVKEMLGIEEPEEERELQECINLSRKYLNKNFKDKAEYESFKDTDRDQVKCDKGYYVILLKKRGRD
jgi:ParB family chromosome partitioning protein